jgi:hypothetical protein
MRSSLRCLALLKLATVSLYLAAAGVGAAVPDGFRGMKWGDPVSRLPNAIAVSNPPGCYANRREDMRLARAVLFGVLYCFDNDRLVRVELRSATGEENLDAFRDAVNGIFGLPPPQPPGSNRNVLAYTAPQAPVKVTLIREVLGVHKYLLVLEYRGAADAGKADAVKENREEARKDFGF